MAREAKFKGTIGYSMQPVAGVTLYTERKPSELSLEEMMEELGKSDIREARKEELLAKLEQRVKKIRGTEKEEKPPTLNPKRYLVDAETGRIDIDEENGEYTYKDALLMSSSIKGKSGQYDDAVALINAAKTLAEGTNKPSGDERKKEFYVDDEGIIHHDPENGELTLSEARALSQSRQKPQAPAPAGFYIDTQGQRHALAPGEPIVVEKQGQPPPSYFVNQKGELQEVKPGQPIVVRVESPSQVQPTPIQLTDKDGRPMVMDIGTLISYKKFEGEERRAEEEQKNKTEMAGAFKEFMTKIANAAAKVASR